MRKRILKNMEWGILICTVILIIIGLVALFSATQNSNYDELKKQIVWIMVSIPILIAIIAIDYELLIKNSPNIIWDYYIVASRSFIYNSNKWCNKLV